MTLKTKQLQKLDNRQFAQDIKQFITSNHEFYETKVPELKTLAKRLHKENTLKQFYRVFNKLWNSGYEKEKTLAIHTLHLYKKDFNTQTYKFLKLKLKKLKDPDKIKNINRILIQITKKHPELKKD